MLSANEILRFFNQLYLKSNRFSQWDFLHAEIDCRNIKGDLKLFSWEWSKMLLTNQIQGCKYQLLTGNYQSFLRSHLPTFLLFYGQCLLYNTF